ncbi:MAG: single-stranded DNA-binding protein [Cyanobacteria bacterium P01_H01_bin.15]
MSLNVVNLVGRAGSDPEVRYFESGSVLCNLSLAVNRPTSREDKPDWFSLEIWGRTAEIAANYVRKGKLLGIQGSLKIDNYTNRNGHACSRPVIRVNRLDLLGSRNEDSNMAGNFGDGDNAAF